MANNQIGIMDSFRNLTESLEKQIITFLKLLIEATDEDIEDATNQATDQLNKHTDLIKDNINDITKKFIDSETLTYYFNSINNLTF